MQHHEKSGWSSVGFSHRLGADPSMSDDRSIGECLSIEQGRCIFHWSSLASGVALFLL
jgi:hypothetical protein